mgnify:CR=1 FL=1
MTIEEWKSIDEIARSTIRMHLAENVYISKAKETTTFKLWEKLQDVYEKQSSSSKLNEDTLALPVRLHTKGAEAL